MTPELLFLALLPVVLFLLLPYRRGRGRRPDQPRAARHLRHDQAGRPPGSRLAPDRKGIKPKGRRNWILVDGSNVMYWEDNTPHLDPIKRVVAALKAQGLDPGVVFDANAGWKLVGRYLGERELGQLLGLPQDQILVVPKGSPADPWLLTTAREFGARIVTNDRYHDWAGDHPEVAEPGFLVHGGLTGGQVWLAGIGIEAHHSSA